MFYGSLGLLIRSFEPRAAERSNRHRNNTRGCETARQGHHGGAAMKDLAQSSRAHATTKRIAGRKRCWRSQARAASRMLFQVVIGLSQPLEYGAKLRPPRIAGCIRSRHSRCVQLAGAAGVCGISVPKAPLVTHQRTRNLRKTQSTRLHCNSVSFLHSNEKTCTGSYCMGKHKRIVTSVISSGNGDRGTYA